jgi:GNAT superfamily N-acetyltransferase
MTIRPITVNEVPLLKDFLYEAIYQPEGAERLPRDIIKTPELAVSLLKKYRKQGIGTALMKKMIVLLKEKSYEQVSLSVDKANYAAKSWALNRRSAVAKLSKKINRII